MNATLLFLSAGLALVVSSCRSDEEKARETTQKIAEAIATSPGQQAKTAAWKAATTLPPVLPASVNLRPGVEQLLPKEGYLHLVSLKPGLAQPAILALPVLWRPTKAGQPVVAPGYRVPFEAVLIWTPAGYGPGERVPDTATLYEPDPQDSLSSFSVAANDVPGLAGSVESRAKRTPIRANEPVTVRGTLYAYAAAAAAGRRGLVIYPYRNPAGLPDPKTMVQIPFN